MKARDKAIELYYKFTCCAPLHSDNKQCALIAVDEILKVSFYATDEIYNFYLEVKQEIEKL